MKFDKDLDIKSIVKESFRDAMKQHGMLEEQGEQETEKFVNVEEITDHTAFIAIKPKEWGVKGTPAAQEIDSILNNISGGASAGLQRYVNCLTNMSRLLGVKVGAQEIPVPDKDSLGGLSEIVSALSLRTLLHQIISEQSPQVAGKIFENFVARMVGGFGVNEEDRVIEDLYDNEMNPISLKVIDRTTEVKGSKYNLAKALAEGKNIRYLICIKDKQKNPFSFKTVSFLITKENYFNFICGKPVVSGTDIKDAIKKIVKTSEVKVESLIREASYGPSSEVFNDALQKYAEQEGLIQPGDAPHKAIRQKFLQYYSEAAPATEEEKKFYDKYLSSLDSEGNALNYNTLKNVIPSGESGKNIIKKNDYYVFKPLLTNLSKVTDSEKKALLGQNYDSKFNKILTKISKLAGFFDSVDKIVSKAESATTQQKTQKQPVSASPLDFFNNIISGVYSKLEGKGETQFYLALSTALDIARTSEAAQFSEDYPTVIIDKNTLFITAQENAKLLKEWYSPVYKKFYKIDQDLKTFFIKNEITGLNQASNSTIELKNEIDVKVKKIGEIGAQKTSDIKSTKLQENKKPLLTNHHLSTILEELLEK